MCRCRVGGPSALLFCGVYAISCLIACSGDDLTTPTPEPSPTPEPVCRLAWDPPAIDFGTVLTRESVSIDATLAAVGTLECAVREVMIEGPASKQFEIDGGPDLPRTILPGGAGLRYTFRFAPRYGGTFEAFVTVDAEDEDVELPLAAVAVMPDEDGDLVDDRDDNCLGLSNPDQWDWDEDGVGDDCDDCPRDPENDVDGDGVCSNKDNCPDVANPDQGDSDLDFIGDACDAEDCDGRDNDGDGLVDEDFDDLDGQGGADCHDDDGDGLSENEGDCNDAENTAYPGGIEAWYDGLDSDCDGNENPDPCTVLPTVTTVEVTDECDTDLEAEFFALCMDACGDDIRVVAAVANRGAQASPAGTDLLLRGVMQDGTGAVLDVETIDSLEGGETSGGLILEPGTFNDIEVYDHLELALDAVFASAEPNDCDESNDVVEVAIDRCAQPDYCEVPRAGYPVPVDLSCSMVLPTHRISAAVKWQRSTFETFGAYDQSAVTPMVGNLTDDNGDGRIDASDTPDIVLVTFVGDQYEADGVLRVISGDGGHEWWSAGGVYALSGIAIGDADPDGYPEIYAMSPDGDLVAFSCDGSLLWTCPAGALPTTYPAVADRDGDGDGEILAGKTVCDHQGNTIVTTDLEHTSETTFFEDIDQDGMMEIISGAGVSSATGETLWEGPGGHAATADFDGDQVPELAIVHDNVLDLYAGGALLWSSIVFEGGNGPPTIADFDNDGAPEIGVAGAHFYMMFDGDGTLVWNSATLDEVSMQTAATVYDLDGNGTAEVIYADQGSFWIIDGATGQKLYQNEDHASRTMLEFPVVADLDGDTRAEIVMASGDFGYASWTGVTVLQDPYNNWVSARPVWNQHTYRASHVGDDLSIPARPAAPWEGDNSFRQGGGGELVPFDVPDLEPILVTRCEADCPRSSTVVFQVENRGLGDAVGPVSYTVYGEDDRGSRFAIVTGTIPDTIPAGWTSPSIEVTLDDDQILGFAALYLEVDDSGSGPGEPNECDETNNGLELPWPCT